MNTPKLQCPECLGKRTMNYGSVIVARCYTCEGEGSISAEAYQAMGNPLRFGRHSIDFGEHSIEVVTKIKRAGREQVALEWSADIFFSGEQLLEYGQAVAYAPVVGELSVSEGDKLMREIVESVEAYFDNGHLIDEQAQLSLRMLFIQSAIAHRMAQLDPSIHQSAEEDKGQDGFSAYLDHEAQHPHAPYGVEQAFIISTPSFSIEGEVTTIDFEASPTKPRCNHRFVANEDRTHPEDYVCSQCGTFSSVPF